MPKVASDFLATFADNSAHKSVVSRYTMGTLFCLLLYVVFMWLRLYESVGNTIEYR